MAETKIMLPLTKAGKLSRVTKLSRKPAVIKIGTKPMVIFTPFFAPCLNDSRRL